jgi:hypothetical protein
MAITYQKKVALLREVVGIDETDGLLEWLRQVPARRLDLSACTHLHAANLQVMMATQAVIAVWPKDANLRSWLESACKPTQGE